MSQNFIMEDSLSYSPKAATFARKSLLSTAENMQAESFYEELLILLGNYHFRCFDQETFDIKLRSLEIYYVLMLARSIHPQFFPTHDQCFFAAQMMKKLEEEFVATRLVVLDWQLLPVAILLAPYYKEISIFSTGSPQELKECSLLIETFSNLFANKIKIDDYLEESLEGAAVLSFPTLEKNQKKDLRTRYSDNSNTYNLDSFSSLAYGVIFTDWSFLGGKKNADFRLRLIQENLLSSCIQLPKPKRQNMVKYPAFMLLKKSKKESKDLKIRFLDFSSSHNREQKADESSIIKLKNMLDYVFRSSPSESALATFLPELDELDDKVFIEVRAEGIINSETYSLLPTYYILKNESNEQEDDSKENAPAHLLRQFASVLRCQVSRKRVQEDSRENEKDSNSKSCVYHEATSKDFDPISGFFNVYEHNLVEMKVLRDSARKYILQENDILISYRGSSHNIGNVHFVDNLDALNEKNLAAVTGPSFCIIRSYSISPFWLYYYLQKQSVRDYLLGKATGASLLVVNTEEVKNIPINLPSLEEKERVEKAYLEVSKSMEELRVLQHKIKYTCKNLDIAFCPCKRRAN